MRNYEKLLLISIVILYIYSMFTIQFWVPPVQESSIFPTKKCSKLGLRCPDLHEAATGAFASDNGGTSLTGIPSCTALKSWFKFNQICCTDSFKMFKMFLTHSIYLYNIYIYYIYIWYIILYIDTEKKMLGNSDVQMITDASNMTCGLWWLAGKSGSVQKRNYKHN